MNEELEVKNEAVAKCGESDKSALLYAVFRYGIYRHECGGIFTSEELAIEAAKKLKTGEPDHYHSFEVIPFEINSIALRPDEQGHCGCLRERVSVFDV